MAARSTSAMSDDINDTDPVGDQDPTPAAYLTPLEPTDSSIPGPDDLSTGRDSTQAAPAGDTPGQWAPSPAAWNAGQWVAPSTAAPELRTPPGGNYPAGPG